ncbi:ribonuclease Z [Candidatus Woesearchaeota archaeon]|nr:ribonuclease Z [Candidatus Woesearchaeota archaeon]
MELTFLGTSCMTPTKQRNVTSFFLHDQGVGILIDCGEGTQRQMQFANINRNRVDYLLITHWHADHTSGIPGLLQTLNAVRKTKYLRLFGPKTTNYHFSHLLKAFSFGLEHLKIFVKEVNSEKPVRFFSNKQLSFYAVNLEHSVPVIGFSIVKKPYRKIDLARAEKFGLKPSPLLGMLQKGLSITHKGVKIKPEDVTYWTKPKKVTFILDTVFTEKAVELAKDSDVLVCESTYAEQHIDKAVEYKHMTAKQAAMIAKQAGVKKLYLTHFSQRYEDLTQLLQEARQVFKNTFLANDLETIKI